MSVKRQSEGDSLGRSDSPRPASLTLVADSDREPSLRSGLRRGRIDPDVAADCIAFLSAGFWLLAALSTHFLNLADSRATLLGMLGIGAMVVIVNRRIVGHRFRLWLALGSSAIAGLAAAAAALYVDTHGSLTLPWWASMLIASGVIAAFYVLLFVLNQQTRFSIARNIGVVGADTPLRQRLLDELAADRRFDVVAVAEPGAIQDIVDLSGLLALDEVILVSGDDDKNFFPAVSMALEMFPVDISIIQDLWGDSEVGLDRWRQFYESRARPRRNRQRHWPAAIKRCVDFTGAAIALILLSPLLLAVAAAVRLESPGPALFKQVRFGYAGRPFLMWKFRSMSNQMADPTGSRLTDRNDSRVTRVGRFIRATSIDELPQLVNILFGSLSIVGPRPHPAGAKANGVLYDVLIPNFKSRYRARPGLTGLAQCEGLRGNTDTEEALLKRFEKDIEYVERWTLLLDVKIVFKTALHLVKGENAF